MRSELVAACLSSVCRLIAGGSIDWINTIVAPLEELKNRVLFIINIDENQ
jgi:hypothetical protein